MNIFSEPHQMFRQAVRGFVEKEVEPHIEEWEAAGAIPRSLWLRMGELGFLGVEYDEQYGGAGADLLMTAVLCEELARSRCLSLAMAVGVHTDMASPHLYWTGSESLKAQHLPAICRGEKVCAIAVTEAGGGSDVAAIRTRAVRDGDHYVLDGSKMFITNGALADIYFVAARLDGERAPEAPRGHLDVPRGARDAGLRGEPHARQDGHARFRHRGARLRGRARARRQPARPGGRGVLRGDARLPARAAGGRPPRGGRHRSAPSRTPSPT